MKKIGITGGIGAGKSTVCEIFRILNVPIYSADISAKSLMNSDEQLIEQIKVAFGSDAYIGKELNRAYLAETVFGDPKKLEKLNSLVHPRVAIDFEQWCEQQDANYIIKEAAILIESGAYKTLDFIINVVAPVDIRKERIGKRDPQRSVMEIDQIFAKQLSDEQRQMYSTHQVINDDTQFLTPQVLVLHQFFSS